MAITQSALQDFEESSARWQKELDHIRTEQSASQEMISSLEEEITKGGQAVIKAETAIELGLQSCEEKKREIESLNEKITQARIQVNACESQKTNIDDIVARIDKAVEELRTECQNKERERLALQQEKDSLDAGHEDDETLLKEKQEAKVHLENYLEELMEERASVIAEGNRLSFEKENLDQQVSSFQSQKYELEIKQAKNETQLDSYKEKLWEDFEISYVQAMDFRSEKFVMSAAQKENRLIKNRMKELGEVNIGAIAEYDTVKERYEFLTTQRADIVEAMESLNNIIEEMDQTIRVKFKESFDQVILHFEETFQSLFGGGHAELRLEDQNNPLESEIEIIAQPPGKKLQNINLLSGGEKAMAAIALMFAVLRTKPTPFCILDEVEAALDDSNIDRFAKYLRCFTDIQFILVTHQKATMEYADILYGVTMPEQGISKILSLDINDDFEL